MQSKDFNQIKFTNGGRLMKHIISLTKKELVLVQACLKHGQKVVLQFAHGQCDDVDVIKQIVNNRGKNRGKLVIEEIF